MLRLLSNGVTRFICGTRQDWIQEWGLVRKGAGNKNVARDTAEHKSEHSSHNANMRPVTAVEGWIPILDGQLAVTLLLEEAGRGYQVVEGLCSHA